MGVWGVSVLLPRAWMLNGAITAAKNMAAFVLVNGQVAPKAKLLWQKADRVSLLTTLDAYGGILLKGDWMGSWGRWLCTKLKCGLELPAL